MPTRLKAPPAEARDRTERRATSADHLVVAVDVAVAVEAVIAALAVL